VALTVKLVEKRLRDGIPGKWTDGAKGGGVRGLMLVVEGERSAYWELRWQRNKRTRTMGLGSARDLPLAAARQKGREERERIARGIDPLEVKQKDREKQQQAEAKRLTFKQAAVACHAALEPGWTNARTGDEFLSSLERWAYSHIGSLDVASVGKNDVLRVLEQKLPRAGGGTFWVKHSQTADRTRARIHKVLDWAEARGYRPEGLGNPARWKGYLDKLLVAPRAVAPVQHLRALSYPEVPALVAKLQADETVAAKALLLTILAAVRVGETLGATWGEINLDGANGPEWVIPKERMKSRKREHRVPLTPEMLRLIEQLPREEGNDFLFISAKTPGVAVTDATVTRALRLAGCTDTTHGFRSSFSDFAAERTAFPSIVAELCLAHRVGNAVENAYRRSDLVVKRRKLMEAWSKYCCTPPAAGAVVAMRRDAAHA
jgi:integrase